MTFKIKKNKKRVLFRADGNYKTGLGHVYRCLAIAERININFECFFAIRAPSDKLKNELSKYSKVIILNQKRDYEEEVEKDLLSIIFNLKIDIITLDGYSFTTNYQKKIKQLSKCYLISIDDHQPYHYVSDMVINHAGGFDSNVISKENYTSTFTGHNFLLLRKVFLKNLNITRKFNGIHSVLICFGGSDYEDFTLSIFNCLKDKHTINRISIIIGAAYLNKDMLLQSVRKYPQTEILENLNSEELSNIMLKTDLAIVPSSTIGLEAFATKMIVITGATSNNQELIYNGLINNITVTGVNFEKLNCKYLSDIINEISVKFSNYTIFSEKKIKDSILDLYKSIL
tara:strand:+ start:1329 stop:2357 length:1029 start_codon:yes stop_codon:yes gene_type:complete